MLELSHIALSPYPSSGYAYSLYRILTGVKLDINLPDLTGIVSTRSNKNQTESIIDEITIYPNPAQDHLVINNISKRIIKEIVIFSAQGQIVFINKPNKTSASIDFSNHSSGLYFVKVTDSYNNVSIKKIVIH